MSGEDGAAGTADRGADGDGEPLLRARGVVSGYGELEVLHGVDVDVYPGEIVLLFGPNGSGKSTFMKTLYGLTPLWDGSITLRGTEMAGVPAHERGSHGLAYVPQVENVFGNLTVAENLAIGGEGAADPGERRREVVSMFPQIEEFVDRKARALSGGQQQMVALARALMSDPDVLLVDEPSAGLAPGLVEEMLDHIGTINDAGTTVVMIEQNVEAGLRVADRGYALDTGENRFSGPADELLAHDEIGRLYLGRG